MDLRDTVLRTHTYTNNKRLPFPEPIVTEDHHRKTDNIEATEHYLHTKKDLTDRKQCQMSYLKNLPVKGLFGRCLST
jgi:hypothetical protein